jgi:GxxExxY protein
MDLVYPEEAYQLVGLAMQVHRELGCGFLEPVYQEAFEILLLKNAVPYEREKMLPIYFMGEKLKKEYFADFVCFDKIIVEFKAVSELTAVHEAQVMNYLKATQFKLGLLFNFGQTSLAHRRIVY